MMKRVLALALWMLAATGVSWAAGDGSCRIVQSMTQGQTDVRPCMPFVLPGSVVSRCLNCPAEVPLNTNSGQPLCVTVRPEVTLSTIEGHLVHGRCVPDVPRAMAAAQSVAAPRVMPIERAIAPTARIAEPAHIAAPAPPRFAAPSRDLAGPPMRAPAMAPMPMPAPHVGAPAAHPEKP